MTAAVSQPPIKKPVKVYAETLLLGFGIGRMKGSAPASRMLFPGIASSGTLTFDPHGWQWEHHPHVWDRSTIALAPSLNRFLTYSFRLTPEQDGGFGYSIDLQGEKIHRTVFLQGMRHMSKRNPSQVSKFEHWFYCPECDTSDKAHRPGKLYLYPAQSWLGCKDCLENFRGERRLIEVYGFYLHTGPKQQGRPRKN